MKIYKVRVRGTNRYSKGGCYVKSNYPYHWSSTGKTWSGSGHLRRHLGMYVDYNGGILIPEDWEIVEIELHDGADVATVKVYDAIDFYLQSRWVQYRLKKLKNSRQNYLHRR